MIYLPVFSGSHYTFHTTLDGQAFILAFDWNAREGEWYVSLADGSGNPLVMSTKIVPNILLWQQYKAAGGLPAGDLIAIDTQNNLQTAQIGFADLGQRYQLCYLELADWLGGAVA